MIPVRPLPPNGWYPLAPAPPPMWCGVVWFGFGSAWAGLFHDRGDHDHERDNDNDDHHHPVSVPSFNILQLSQAPGLSGTRRS